MSNSCFPVAHLITKRQKSWECGLIPHTFTLFHIFAIRWAVGKTPTAHPTLLTEAAILVVYFWLEKGTKFFFTSNLVKAKTGGGRVQRYRRKRNTRRSSSTQCFVCSFQRLSYYPTWFLPAWVNGGRHRYRQGWRHRRWQKEKGKNDQFSLFSTFYFMCQWTKT